MVYDRLILSDIHLYTSKEVVQTNNWRIGEFLDYLYENGDRFKSVILLGDIFETWYVDSEEEIKRDPKLINSFFDKLDKIILNERIYVIGNHDTKSSIMKLPSIVNEILEVNNFHVCTRYEEDQIVFVHGHQGSISSLGWFLQMMGVKIWYWICKVFRSPSLYKWGFGFVERNASYRSSDEKKKLSYYRDLIKRVKPEGKIIIFGHTHVPTIDKDMKIVNTGDWMENMTFVVQHDGFLTLHGYDSYPYYIDQMSL